MVKILALTYTLMPSLCFEVFFLHNMLVVSYVYFLQAVCV